MTDRSLFFFWQCNWSGKWRCCLPGFLPKILQLIMELSNLSLTDWTFSEMLLRIAGKFVLVNNCP
jgi:hypothetical protein